jgi:periplasmic protein TonB
MFEGSMVESRRLAGTGTERWTALGSMTIQCAVAGLLIAIPLLRPEMLETAPSAPLLTAPFLRKPPVVPVQTRTTTNASATMSLPAAGPVAVATGRTVWPRPGVFADGPAPIMDPNLRMGGGGTGIPLNLGAGIGTVPVAMAAKPKEAGPVNVSTGVSVGLLLSPIQPVYPPIAISVRVQGEVVIEAVISKTGKVESVNVVSGPAMLRQAAVDAVAAARYRPYLLNGQPTEVRTTYRVMFSLGG